MEKNNTNYETDTEILREQDPLNAADSSNVAEATNARVPLAEVTGENDTDKASEFPVPEQETTPESTDETAPQPAAETQPAKQPARRPRTTRSRARQNDAAPGSKKPATPVEEPSSEKSEATDEDAHDLDEPEEERFAIPETLPILPLKDTVIYPFSVQPFAVGQERYIRLDRRCDA